MEGDFSSDRGKLEVSHLDAVVFHGVFNHAFNAVFEAGATLNNGGVGGIGVVEFANAGGELHDNADVVGVFGNADRDGGGEDSARDARRNGGVGREQRRAFGGGDYDFFGGVRGQDGADFDQVVVGDASVEKGGVESDELF